MASLTSKRTMAKAQRAAALVGIRIAFGVLERVAPDVGAMWAERLWFTVPGTPASRKSDGLPAGDRIELRVNGQLVVGQSWGTGPVVVLMHGWGGRRGDLAALVAPLVSSGHRVVAFDAPGHGESTYGASGRRRSTILEFSDALAAVCRDHGPARAIVAHSLGCMASGVALRDGVVADKVVLIAPMAQVRPYTEVFARRVGFGGRVLSRMNARIERRVATPLSAFDVPAIGTEMATPPVLLLHDRGDQETRFADSVAISETWLPSKLHATSGLGHRRILRDPTVVREIVDFIGMADLINAGNAAQTALRP